MHSVVHALLTFMWSFGGVAVQVVLHLVVHACAFGRSHMCLCSGAWMCSFIHSGMRVFLWSIVRPLVHAFVESFGCPVSRAHVHVGTQLVVCAFIGVHDGSFIHSLIRSVMHLFFIWAWGLSCVGSRVH